MGHLHAAELHGKRRQCVHRERRRRATNLTPHEGERNFTASDIAPDGKTVLITSNAAKGYENAGLIDVATKKITWLTSEQWETTSGKFSPDGKRLAWTTNIDGNQDIYVYASPRGMHRRCPWVKASTP